MAQLIKVIARQFVPQGSGGMEIKMKNEIVKVNPEDNITPLEDKKVFKHSADGIALYVFLCSIFVMSGFMMLENEVARTRHIGLMSIIFFGGAGLFFLIFMSWKPILTVSKEGVAKPTLHDEKFVSWAEISEIRQKVQTVSTRYNTTTIRYIGIFTFEGRQDNTTFEYFKTELNKLATGWMEMPTLLIKNQKIFSGVKCEELVEIMEQYHAEYVFGLPEEEKSKYENVFHHTVTGKLKNTANFVGNNWSEQNSTVQGSINQNSTVQGSINQDNTVQGSINQDNTVQDKINQESMNVPPKVSDHINWEKISIRDDGNWWERFLRKISEW